jgi:SAM-dependent methyltransferase
MVEPAELKQNHRKMWASGDYNDIATHVSDVGESVAGAAELGDGVEVLDVGAGGGNASIPAARSGAKVTASDLTPELFDVGRQRAADAGVEIEWVEADAEDLPFPDASFDRVLSAIGAMFAPRHQVVADELARVCRPGGMVVMGNWTPEGLTGQMFKLNGSYMPPPPDYASPPTLWGSEDHVRELFAPHGLELGFEKRNVHLRADDADSWVTYMETNFGPMLMAKNLLTQDGRWDELRGKLVELHESKNTATDGGLEWDQEYLLVTGRKPA